MKTIIAMILQARTGFCEPQVCMIPDGAIRLQGLHRKMTFPVTPAVDWVHISMRVRYLEQIVKGLPTRSEIEQHTKSMLSKPTTKLRWCYWHASFDKAENKIRQALVLCRIIGAATPTCESSLRLLEFRLRDLWAYIESNRPAIFAYG